MLNGKHCRLASTMAALALLFAAPAAADTICLKSGRMLHTDEARVESGRVIFTQFGATAALSMELVDRVEDNDEIGPVPSPPMPVRPVASAGEDVAADTETVAETPLVENTREYWFGKLMAICAELRDLVDGPLDGGLRRMRRAMTFGHYNLTGINERIQRVEDRLADLDDEERRLRREARRRSIPPGWLR
jgi:hypothetical protein